MQSKGYQAKHDKLIEAVSGEYSVSATDQSHLWESEGSLQNYRIDHGSNIGQSDW